VEQPQSHQAMEPEDKIIRILKTARSNPYFPELSLRDEPELIEAYCEWAIKEYACRSALLQSESLVSLVQIRKAVHLDCTNKMSADVSGLIVEGIGTFGPRRLSEVIARAMNEVLELKQLLILHNHRRAEESIRPSRRVKRIQTSIYPNIDKLLKDIEVSKPQSQREVFKLLDARALPSDGRPFQGVKGWLAWYEKYPGRARPWLSKRWGRLGLTGFRRGPKPSLP
jgi:hypothetical protein